VQRPLTSGPRRWPSGPTLQPLTGRLHDDTLYEAVTGNPKLKVGGGRTPWPAGLGRLATTWRVIDLTKSVTPPWTPYKYPLSVEINTPHSTYSSPLVKIPVL
jgi:hypothetical protein